MIESQGLRLTARRPQPRQDFIASTDAWFRPASLASGPDGALYLADMYRLWVEHPKFLPPEIAARLDWRAGDDRGRIYRIVPTGTSPKPFRPPTSVEATVALLHDANGWRQFLGQRLLVEQNAAEAVAGVRRLLDAKDNPTTPLHALWTLHGLSALTPQDLLSAMSHEQPGVRVAGVRLAIDHLDQPKVFRAVSLCAEDEDVRVRFEVALTLSASDSEEATDRLAALALRDGHDPMFVDGLLTSTKERSGKILSRLVSDRTFSQVAQPDRINLVKRLSAIIGARGDVAELVPLFDRLRSPQQPMWWRAASLSGVAEGLSRHRGNLGRTSLAKLISDPPLELAASVAGLAQIFIQNEQIARSVTAGPTARAAAIELLSHQPFSKSSALLSELLGSDQPLEVQTACIHALSRNGSLEAAKVVLHCWPELGPTTRGPALALLLRRSESTRLALQAMVDGSIPSSGVGVDQRVRLLKHADKSIRGLAEDLFGGAVSSDRRQVAKQYEPCLTWNASATDGQKVFTRVCAACHRIDGVGHDAGPDLSDVRNRSKPALLYDILDPNAKVEPRFAQYTIVTLDGQVFNGLVQDETSDAVTLTMAEGKRKVIGRGEIDQIVASKASLMPEGVEKQITLRQMADLLEFLKRRQ